MELTATEAWARVLERARPLLSEQTFRIWLEHTEPLALTQDQLTVSAGSDFAAEWIEDKYGDMLGQVAERVFGRPLSIAFQHQNAPGGSSATSHPRPAPAGLEADAPRPAPAPGPAPSSGTNPNGAAPGGVAFGS